MELRVLNYFLTAAREENITRAAQLLHVTQPTLSRQLMQLEEELGTKLFRRGRHSIALTEEGALLQRRAEELLALAEKTRQELAPAAELVGEIAIGSGDLHSTRVLTDALARFRQAHPQVRFELFSGNSDNIKARIERGSLDLGLLVEPVDISHYRFLRMPVRESWGAWVNADSPLAEKDVITPQDLSGMPVILTKRTLMQNEFQSWFGTRLPPPEIVCSGNLPYNLAMLAKSLRLPFVSVRLDCTYDGMCYVPLSPRLAFGTVLVWKKTQTFSAATAAFLDYIQAYIKSISCDSV